MATNRIEQLHGRISGTFVNSLGPCRTGLVVLGGSSGRVDIARAQLFANTGACALALRWFGGLGQSSGICEIPLETFVEAVDYLEARGCERIVFVGTSKGAEASLLAATIDPRISAVVAISPSSVVWGNIGAGTDGVAWPERSSWSFGGRPLDFVPAVPDWQKEYRDGLVSYRSFFEKCLLAVDAVTRARIPIEASAAEIILVAGGDDALWPSDIFARRLALSRKDCKMATTLIIDQDAGHRVLFPGELTPRSTQRVYGGSDAADARLGQKAWQAVTSIL